MFYRIATETAGIWDNIAIELVQEIGRCTSHHRGHQRNSLSVSTPVYSSAARECGLPQHNEHRMRSRCSRCLTLCLAFTSTALCWWPKIIMTKNDYLHVTARALHQYGLSVKTAPEEMRLRL